MSNGQFERSQPGHGQPGHRRFRDTHPVPELLAPAGGPAPFNAALAAGADAIYCGLGNDFNARRGADNFDDETFAEACRAAHLAGARVYVTENVVIRTEEMPAALALVRRAWLLGADAFIIQDWGLLAEVRRLWPQIECHVSTQANVHDARGVAWCRELGVDRVTLSRELSVAEIARIAEEGVELESFGHGALCFCYSGVCMMSSLSGARSANRGLCAQPCRLTYELVDETGERIAPAGWDRPLCPRDYCTIDDLARLAEAGLGSLKVEGRMKAPDYVHSVVSAYRGALDDLAARHVPSAREDEARHELLRRAFNRDFTNSYLDHRSDNDMMSYERSNNRGELVGSVLASRDLGSTKVRRGGRSGGRDRFRTVTRAEVDIRLERHVGRGDLLEIRPVADPSQFLTVHAQDDAAAGDVITCMASRPMEPGSPVRVIRSQRAMDAGARAAKGEEAPKRKVRVRVIARLGEPFAVELETADGPGSDASARAAAGTESAVSARAEGFVVEPARTKAVSKDDLVEHVGRMGQTPFEPVSIEVELDEGCGMGFSAVHKVRAEACALLEQAILAPTSAEARGASIAEAPTAAELAAANAATRERVASVSSADTARADARIAVDDAPVAEVCALVPSVEVAKAAVAAGATRLYATADAIIEARDGGESWPAGVPLVPWLDEVCRECDHDRLDPLVEAGLPCAVGNVSELALSASRGAVAEVRPCVPVHNESCLVALERAGARGVWLSPELTLDEVCALAEQASVPVGLVVSGRTRAMTSEHCVLQAADRCVHDCATCGLRQEHCSLRDRSGALLPVRTDAQGRSRIYSAYPLDATPQAGELLAAGVTRLMADCTLLSADEASLAVERVARAVEAAREGRRPAGRAQGATSGHLFMGIA